MSGRPETPARDAHAPHEVQPERDQDERDRELLDYLIEITWAAYVRRLRSERDQ